MTNLTSPIEFPTKASMKPVLGRFRFKIWTLMTVIAVSAFLLPFATPPETWFQHVTPSSGGSIQCSPCWISPAHEAAIKREIANRTGQTQLELEAEDLENAVLKRDMASEFFMLGSDPKFRELARELLREADLLQNRSGILSKIGGRKLPQYEPEFDDEIQLEPISR
jgi:hypothetical protein